jgi:dihydrofolate synthase / folylpolyglutamate synthase
VDGELTTSDAYHRALDFLFVRTTGATRLGLDRMEALLEALGDPHRRLRAFHVAGTNGKGSACATLDALLRARGLRVGRYTSPHLVDFRERILVAGAPIPEDVVVAWVERWTPTCERLGITFFEATTALAFDHFAQAGLDAAVIEVGLGGRLDATNVVVPLATGVTSIGVDHAELLGPTREVIAGEKAGIFKRGVPAVLGEADPDIRTILARHAADREAAPVVHVPDAYPTRDVRMAPDGTRFVLRRGDEEAELRTPLTGAFQAGNAALAIAMLDAAGEEWRCRSLVRDVAPALASVRLAGRFDRRPPWIFDVAHNPDGAAVLADTVRAVAPDGPVVALLTVLEDKDWRGIMRALAPVVERFVLTRAPSAPASRAWQPETALVFAREQGWQAALEPDFARALALAPTLGGTVLVTGSFHTVGDAMLRLQLNPLPG